MTTTTFDYRVRDAAGTLINGRLEAESSDHAAKRLRDMGYVPIGIDRSARLDLHREIRIPHLNDRVRLKDVSSTSRQLATMVTSGLSLIRALGLLVEQANSQPLKSALSQVRADVERGTSLSEALARHPRIFDRLYVSMVHAGEMSGQLDDVLLTVATSIEKRVELRAKVRSAMAYPVVMAFVAIAIVVAMMIVVVPTFARLYGEFHGKLPLPTRIVITASRTLASPWAALLVAIAFGAVVAVRKWLSTPRGRHHFDAMKLRVPIFGPLSRNICLERLAAVLGSLIGAGVGIIEALDLAAENAGNSLVADAVLHARAAVREGRTLGSALAECPVIPPMFIQMVETGEESGAVGELLDKVAGFYRGEVETTVNGLTTLLEPLLVVVMGGIVGSIVVSLYLPMFKYITLVSNAR
jgi:type IV pilus assembly protein PilC